jgi:IS1 family transposase
VPIHDRVMVGLRVGRIECDELWAYVGKKQRHLKPGDSREKGDQYTFVALASTSRSIVSYLTGKRDSASTDTFMADLRDRVLGSPEISTDGFKPYMPSIRDHFSNSSHGVINKTYSVTHLTNIHQAQHRYSPAAVIKVEREVAYGVPAEICTSYVERSNLSIRMANRRFTRLTNGFSKKLENHAAAISLYVMHYNFCRVHESLKSTPAVQLGIADHAWSLGELVDAAIATQPIDPVIPAPQRRKRFRVIDGGVS